MALFQKTVEQKYLKQLDATLCAMLRKPSEQFDND